MGLNLTSSQKQLIIELLRDRHSALVDMAANAASFGDHCKHDSLANEYWDISQVLKQIDSL